MALFVDDAGWAWETDVSGKVVSYTDPDGNFVDMSGTMPTPTANKNVLIYVLMAAAFFYLTKE